MDPLGKVQPLSYTKRRRTFFFLLTLFVVSLPFLYLYATGYRFDPRDKNAIVGTGGMYVAAERTGAQIYIDDELVRETRVFRTAFYAQNLEPRTHKVHVQKEDHHTWVKELPVTSHRVTEAQAFNLPIVPQIRVVSEWVTGTGTALIGTSTLPFASTTNEVNGTTTKLIAGKMLNSEYVALRAYFSTTTANADVPLIRRVQEEIAGTTTEAEIVATTTKVSGGVRLREGEDGVYAEWVGSFEQMPYYYCAKPFSRYSTTTVEGFFISAEPSPEDLALNAALTTSLEEEDTEPEFIHPLEHAEESALCDRSIKMSTPSEITEFEFFPGSTDLVVLGLADGIYVSEIDNRAWQNLQPILKGTNLQVHVENGSIYVYDGTLIYQVILES